MKEQVMLQTRCGCTRIEEVDYTIRVFNVPMFTGAPVTRELIEGDFPMVTTRSFERTREYHKTLRLPIFREVGE